MNNEATIYPIYCEYYGKKSPLMDTVSKLKANSMELADNEKVYALIEIVKLYCFAEFSPVSTVLKEKQVVLKHRKTKEEIVFDFDKIKTQKDYSMALLNNLTIQPKYYSATDKVRAVMEGLRLFYKKGKEFDDFLKSFYEVENLDKTIILNALSDVTKFLKDQSEVLGETSLDNNITNIVFSEVKEDLEELRDRM